MFYLSQELFFPPVSETKSHGIVALGGDLSSERLQLAYKSGIFPWFEDGEPITWWSPDPRMILFLDELVVSKSMRNVLNRNMIEAYCKLNELGIAKSVEVWQNNELVAGLYGIDLGHVFCGESMFSKVSNASKVAFITLVKHLQQNDYKLLDCQVYNPHLESLGCREIDRIDFMELLKKDQL